MLRRRRVYIFLDQNGGIPNNPVNRRPHITAASAVDPIKVSRARVAHADRQPPPWLSTRYQPRPSISKVMPRNGQVSTRNAGARASPADVPPRRPSRPGTTHHQGRGNSPLNKATKGISTRNSFSIVSPFPVTHLRHNVRECSRDCFVCSRESEFRPVRMTRHELNHWSHPIASGFPRPARYSTQQLISDTSRVKDWATRLMPSLRVGNTWTVSTMSSTVRPNFTASVASWIRSAA